MGHSAHVITFWFFFFHLQGKKGLRERKRAFRDGVLAGGDASAKSVVGLG